MNEKPIQLEYPSVEKSLEAALDQFKAKNASHGETWLDFGGVMKEILPRLPAKMGFDDWQRLGVFVQIVHKIMRYGKMFADGGCKNSSGDLVTYAGMLDALTDEFAPLVNQYSVLDKEGNLSAVAVPSQDPPPGSAS